VFRRIDDLTIELHATPDTHLGRLIRACWNLGTADGWHRLRRYAHQFGCGGHITTKSRAFSVTYGFLRLQRTIWRRTQGFPHLWDDQQADLVVSRLGYEATGWITTRGVVSDASGNYPLDVSRRATQTLRALTAPHRTHLLPRRTLSVGWPASKRTSIVALGVARTWAVYGSPITSPSGFSTVPAHVPAPSICIGGSTVNYIAPTLGDCFLSDITPGAIRAWRAELMAVKISPTMTAKAYRLLRAVMNTAVDDELIRRKPLPDRRRRNRTTDRAADGYSRSSI
jgi:replication initiator protein RepSA